MDQASINLSLTEIIILVVLTYILLIWYLQFRGINKEYQSSKTWLTTQGVIAKSSVISQIDQDEFGSSQSYGGLLNYTYRVNAIEYTGYRKKIGVMFLGPSKKVAERGISMYTEGSSVTVYYDPEEPERSVLELGINRRWTLLPKITIMLYFIVVLVLYINSGEYFFINIIGYIAIFFVNPITWGIFLFLILIRLMPRWQTRIMKSWINNPNYDVNAMFLKRPGIKQHLKKYPGLIEALILFPEFRDFLNENQDIYEFYEQHPKYSKYLDRIEL